MIDFHVHSNFSNDGRSTVTEMVRAEIGKGIQHMCFTDHVEDCNLGEPVSYDIGCFTDICDEYIKTVAEAGERFGRAIMIGAGIELSGINHDPEKAARLASIDGLDFIIGSVHNNKGKEDFYAYPYESLQQCNELLEDYLRENSELVKCACCDVVGHIGYPLNYMQEKGFKVSLYDHYEQVRELLKEIVQSGIGIEINTSGFRRKINEAAPDAGIVKLYRELGGEIITVGSDGHDTSQAGFGVEKGFEILRATGFKYVSVFKNRKPQFIKI